MHRLLRTHVREAHRLDAKSLLGWRDRLTHMYMSLVALGTTCFCEKKIVFANLCFFLYFLQTQHTDIDIHMFTHINVRMYIISNRNSKQIIKIGA